MKWNYKKLIGRKSAAWVAIFSLLFQMGFGASPAFAASAPTTYTVTYDGNGSTSGSVPVDASSPYLSGSTVTVKDNTGVLAKTCSTFNGWNTKANGSGTSYNASDTFSIGANTTLYAKWAAVAATYTATFNSNGGSDVPSQTGIACNGAITKPTDPGKTGYTFGGWYTDNITFNNAWNFTTKIVADTTLYAKWTAKPYSVTYFANGSTGGTAPTDSAIYHINDTVTVKSIGNLTKSGYDFVGWNTACSSPTVCSGTEYAPSATFTMGSANVELYAKWSAIPYTATFMSNGSVYATQASMTYGDKITQPADPTRLGYTFGGWYTDITYTTAWKFNQDTITGSTTLYAKWTAIPYTASFDSNGGSAVVSQTNMTYGDKITKPADPTLAHYVFVGWYSDHLLTNAWDFNTGITGNTTLYAKWKLEQFAITVSQTSNGTISPSSGLFDYNSDVTFTITPSLHYHVVDVLVDGQSVGAVSSYKFSKISTVHTITATYVIDTVTLTYNAGSGGSIVGTSPQVIDYGTDGSTVTATADAGYNFLSWSDGVTTAERTDLNVTTNLGVTAEFTKKLVLTYDANTGSGAPIADALKTKKTNGVLTGTGTISATVPTKTGYTFDGWYENCSSATICTGSQYLAGDTINITSNTTLYAKWLINQYSLSYDGNGNDGGNVPAASTLYDYDTNQTVLGNVGSPILYKTGYTFDGWNTSSDGTGTAYAAGDTIKIPGHDVTLYAKWKVNQYTITFDSNGGSTVSALTQDYGSTITAPSDPTKTCYDFAGWSPSLPSTMPAQDMTLVASWTQINYTVSFNSKGGTDVSDITVGCGDTFTAPAAPTKTDFNFLGWFNGGVEWVFANDKVNSNLTLEADWSKKEAAMIYDGNGNTEGLAPQDTTKYSLGDEVTVLGEGSLAKTGYSFNGWNSKADGSGVSYAVGDKFTVTSPVVNQTLYAQWSVNVYKIQYSAGVGGTLNMVGFSPSDSYTINVEYGKSAPVVTAVALTGYRFVKWSDGVTTASRTIDNNIAADLAVTAEFAKNIVSIDSAVLGASTNSNRNGSTGSSLAETGGTVLGSTKAGASTDKTNESSKNAGNWYDANFWGVAWYWWATIVALAGAAWWYFTGYQKPKSK